ncbi:hypothetical protein D3C78_1126920 [compost metagenome]
MQRHCSFARRFLSQGGQSSCFRLTKRLRTTVITRRGQDYTTAFPFLFPMSRELIPEIHTAYIGLPMAKTPSSPVPFHKVLIIRVAW